MAVVRSESQVTAGCTLLLAPPGGGNMAGPGCGAVVFSLDRHRLAGDAGLSQALTQLPPRGGGPLTFIIVLVVYP